jgi:hypothetical protein
MVEIFAFGGGFSRGYFNFGLKSFFSCKDAKEEYKKFNPLQNQ